MRFRYFNIASLFVATTVSIPTSFNTSISCANTKTEIKPRIFILTDISNEPDDTESLVRLLLHSDMVQIEGIAAVTSVWLVNTTRADQIYVGIEAYSEVYDNLQKHTAGEFPTTDYLNSIVYSGPPVYGTAALSSNNSFTAAQALLDAAFSSSEPLYIQAWGGVNVLAQALLLAQNTQNETYISTFISRVRIYSISDQDDAGAWIRMNFPSLRYTNSIHGWNNYGLATWSGISGDTLYDFDNGGPDTSLVNISWIKAHIQLGPLGSYYPDPAYIMEGDTPSMLFHLPVGLGSPEHPNWGSWGGRYMPSDPTLAINHWTDTTDIVTGKNGNVFQSNHATIWRWRAAYQAEIAARIQWSLSANYTAAPHAPVVVLNESCDTSALLLTAEVGSTIVLNATGTYDPDVDGLDNLDFKWWQYRDVTATQWGVDREVPDLAIDVDISGLVTNVTMPDDYTACGDVTSSACHEFHVILEVTKKSGLPLTRYKRVVVQLTRNETV